MTKFVIFAICLFLFRYVIETSLSNVLLLYADDKESQLGRLLEEQQPNTSPIVVHEVLLV